jgi:hypothetical protein
MLQNALRPPTGRAVARPQEADHVGTLICCPDRPGALNNQASGLFADDRLLPFDDTEWRLDHSTRRYRVRPWREQDGQPSGYTFPCVTVIDFAAHRKLAGWPTRAAANYPLCQDTDAWAAWCFAENDRLLRVLS